MGQEKYKVDTVSLNGVNIPFSTANLDPAIEIFAIGGGSSTGPTLAGMNIQKPMITLSTPALKVILDVTGIEAVVVTEATFYLSKQDAVGSVDGLNHIKLVINDGLAVVQRIGASGIDEASVDIEIHAVDDGTNAPFVVTGGQALPATNALAELFYLGPLVLDATTYETQSIEYNPGVEVDSETHSGNTAPTLAGVVKVDPEVTIETLDAAVLTGLTAQGDTVANTAIYFRKAQEATGGRVADATAEHIKITIPAGCAYPGQIGGDWATIITAAVTVKPTITGGGAPATLSTASAIT